MASVPAVIPPLNVASLGTVVISGSGVHTVGATGTVVRPMVAAGAPGRGATSRLRIPRPPSPALAARRLPAAPAFSGGANGSYQVATILFDNGSSRLKSNDRRILRQVAAQHRQTGGVIRIVGHASSRTRSMDVIRHKMVNFEVSAARAESVAKALAGMGAKPESLVIGAAADREPKYYEFMPSGEAGNRRAEIFIEY
jgi:outer membrane protein OmpA-like peptidoglycan-associated protein